MALDKTDSRADRDGAGKESDGRGKARRSTRSAASSAQSGVGGALRSVYDQTVDEAIPQDLLDLLGKLD